VCCGIDKASATCRTVPVNLQGRIYSALVLCIIYNFDEVCEKEERFGQNSLRNIPVKEVY